jgi:phosphoribosylformylglycinamidine cyclo-ligase
MGLRLTSRLSGVPKALGAELLRVHRNYQPLLAILPLGLVKGVAHITGGGFVDNLPRVLPKNCNAVIETESWKVPAIFRHIEKGGGVEHAEMYQVFNMGIGMTLIVGHRDAAEIARRTNGTAIGCIEPGSGEVRLKF